MSDEQIREFFHNNRPVTGDEGTYLAGLSAKLEAVESIKELQKEAGSSYRRAILKAAVGGLALGIILTYIYLSGALDKIHLPGIVAVLPGIDTAVSSVDTAINSVKMNVIYFISARKTLFIFLIASASVILALIPWKRSHR